MVFSSVVFLFFFLPLSLAFYFIVPRAFRNAALLLLSLAFYVWGEMEFAAVLLLSITVNYGFGLLLSRYRTASAGRVILLVALFFNIGLLVIFKYANFLVDNINPALRLLELAPIQLDPIHLPLGISFFTFHALSYIIDIRRGTTQPERSYVGLGMYIGLFPYQISGPIVRYNNIAAQLVSRRITRNGFAEGAQRFVLGLAKKALIADNLAAAADQIFVLKPEVMGTDLAWIGIVCYTLQIYFDFSGYSDMAIGLAAMFGFRIPENFNFPYIATSIRDFWKRWHMSLTSWIRDYLFLPFTRSLLQKTKMRHVRLVEVFVHVLVMGLVGLWHGASWNFVVWGVIHGSLMVAESQGYGFWLSKRPRVFRHLYTLLVVMIAWVFFRTETLSQAWEYLRTMFSFQQSDAAYSIGLYLTNEALLALVAAVIFSMPVVKWGVGRTKQWQEQFQESIMVCFQIGNGMVNLMVLAVLFVLSIMSILSGTYSPFIYFRF